jgi:hypothetical protein
MAAASQIVLELAMRTDYLTTPRSWPRTAVLLLVAVVLVGCDNQADPLPAVSDIDSIEARTSEGVRFDVPKKHWVPILDAMRPARKDNDPAKWQVLGELNIRLKGGKSLFVALYTTSKWSGAFSAGRTFKERVYYRGGDSAKLKQTFQAAYAASQQGK